MVKRTGPTDINLRKLISDLNKNKSGLWRAVAEDLGKARRGRREVSVARLNRVIKDGEVIVVPGKVLGTGSIEGKKATIAAWQFSSNAEEKLRNAGFKILSIPELVKEDKSGKKVRIIG